MDHAGPRGARRRPGAIGEANVGRGQRMSKVVVVTGAGTGIGKAAAIAFLRAGDRVVLAGRRKELLEGAVTEAAAPAGRAVIVPTDVGDRAAVHALFERTREAFGRLDVLFNNAGIGAPGVPLEDLTFE